MIVLSRQELLAYIRLPEGTYQRINQLYTIMYSSKIRPEEFVDLVGKTSASDTRGLIMTGFIGKLLAGDLSRKWLKITELEGCHFNKTNGDTLIDVVDISYRRSAVLTYTPSILVGDYVDFLYMNPHITRQDIVSILGGIPLEVTLLYRDYKKLKQNGQDDCFYRVEFVRDRLELSTYLNKGKDGWNRGILTFIEGIYREEWYYD